MCGIAGLLTLDRPVSQAIASIQASIDAQRHRGPDDAGLQSLCAGATVAVFGHRRLAIIDTSSAGHQPMQDHETGNWIVFNGEIYNFKELRKNLETEYSFRTNTDTEVILKAYAKWGAQGVSRLQGIFAFALWDAAQHQLLLARDQLGVKPLYYWQDDRDFVFASEVRALLATNIISRKIDLHGLHSYLEYGSVQEPLTLVKGVSSLPPGHTLHWKAGQTSIRRYWQIPASGEVQHKTAAEMTSLVSERLRDAVKLQMISDVPIGAFLSGGIDSTAVAALMQSSAAGKVKTFAVIYNEAEYDEREYSRKASRYIGTNHQELLLTGEVVKDELPMALAAFDQPSVDGLNTYFVSKATKEAGLTVALSGVGGDELFAGYNGYAKTLRMVRWGSQLQALPSIMRGGLKWLIEISRPNAQWRMVADILENILHPYFASRQVLSRSQTRDILKVDAQVGRNGWYPDKFKRSVLEAGRFDPVNFASALELQTYMLSTLLRDTDQMSMAHALEVRVPLIDHKVVELMFQIHGQNKIDPNIPKPMLTKALGNLIPRECVFRQKRGFTLPLSYWLREGLGNHIKDSLCHDESGLFVPRKLANLWDQFQQGRLSWSRVWMIFVLRDWLSRHKMVLG